MRGKNGAKKKNMKQKKKSLSDEILFFMMKVMGSLALILIIAAGVDIAKLFS